MHLPQHPALPLSAGPSAARLREHVEKAPDFSPCLLLPPETPSVSAVLNLNKFLTVEQPSTCPVEGEEQDFLSLKEDAVNISLNNILLFTYLKCSGFSLSGLQTSPELLFKASLLSLCAMCCFFLQGKRSVCLVQSFFHVSFSWKNICICYICKTYCLLRQITTASLCMSEEFSGFLPSSNCFRDFCSCSSWEDDLSWLSLSSVTCWVRLTTWALASSWGKQSHYLSEKNMTIISEFESLNL